MSDLELNTSQKFRDSVLDLLKRHNSYEGTLEEYLRALWAQINHSRQVMPSWDILFSLLEKAFSTPPAEFDPKWLAYEQPLNWSYRDGSYVLEKSDYPDFRKIIIVESNVSEFRILKHTLLFEISDLYRMLENHLKRPGMELYLGISSPTKNDWYNFDVRSFLECGTATMDGIDTPLSG